MENTLNSAKSLIILVRHGQTEWNRNERFRGRADIPLNATGLAQAEATAQRIAMQWQPAAIYSSPLSRAFKTAEAIARRTSLQVQIHPGLNDIDYGEWQGLSPEEVRQRWPQELGTWYNQPHLARIPGGETLDQVRQRAFTALNELIALHPNQTLVLVAHTVVNRLLLLAILGLGNERFWRLRQKPCAINIFEAEAGDFTLIALNDICHLYSKQFAGEDV